MKKKTSGIPKCFKQVRPGEWEKPVMRNYFLKCCNCGSVHRMNFRILDGRVYFQAFRVDDDAEKLKESR